MDYFHLCAGQDTMEQISVLGLAHLGDGVYELMVRAWLCLHGKATNKGLHRAAVTYVSAPAQAQRAQKILPVLTQEEQDVFPPGPQQPYRSDSQGSQRGPVSHSHCAGGVIWLAVPAGRDRPAQRTVHPDDGGITNMPLDAICLTAVAAELRRAVIGGKVDKIYQPTRDEVVLHMRTGQGNVRMLLSANPQHPRAHLTETPRENPDTPPMFCMLLRKYFLGGRILAITQPSMERLLEFQFETLSELGDRVERRLVLECIGRKANLIMLDGEGRITDCLRRVEGDLSARRPLMPGMFYQAPGAHGQAGSHGHDAGGPAPAGAGAGPGGGGAGQMAAGHLQRPIALGRPGTGVPGGW